MDQRWTEATDNGTAAAERDRVRIEFYATYDLMTGVRIAATLGGFFALMVFLIVYKSRSKSVKAMNDPKLVELAEAVVEAEEAEEEERALTAVLEEAWAARGSLGGARYPRSMQVSLAPRRLSTLRGDSLPGSVLRVGDRRWSALSARDRRLSSATCSSSGSGYLERRPSSVMCALERRQTLCSRRMAPLASAGASFAVECELASVGCELVPVGCELASVGCELASVGCDSVFAEDDTDGEVEQFSTDSGGGEMSELSRPVPPTPHANHSRETLF